MADETIAITTHHSGREEFVLITCDFQAGEMRHMSHPMSEDEFRVDLAKRGYSPSEIDVRVSGARTARLPK